MNKILVLFILFTVFLTSASPLFACSIRLDNPWYIIHLDFDKTTLPPNMTLEATESVEVPFKVSNASSKPLYLIDTGVFGKPNPDYYKVSELPYGTVPLVKLQDNTVYFQDGHYQDPWTWEKRKEIDAINEADVIYAKYALIDDRDLQRMGTTIKNTHEDTRPKELKGKNEPFEFKVYSGGEEYTVKGTARYDINPNFVPYKTQNAIQKCNALMRGDGDKKAVAVIIGVMALIVFVVALSTIMMIKAVYKMSNKKK